MNPGISSRAKELLKRIEQLSTPAFKKQMRERFGINTTYAVGTPVTALRKLIKTLPRPDQALADELWASGIHEARIMASMLADATHITRTQLDSWACVINSWDLCDACACNLFCKVKNPVALAEHWMKKEEEFVRRAGFATLAFLAMPRAKTEDKDLIKLLPFIKNHAADPRPMVYKAVNWALRNIGKKNQCLTPHALACAYDILDLYADNRTARWVADNALWELHTPKVKAMLALRK